MPEFDPLGNITNNSNGNNNSSSNTAQNDTTSSFDSLEVKYLKSIDATLREFVQNSERMSQSAYNTDRRRASDYYADRYSDGVGRSRYRRNSTYMNTRSYRNASSQTMGSFLDEFERQFTKEFFGSDFKKGVQNASKTLANLLGVQVEEVGSTMGKYLGRQTIRVLKGSKAIQDQFDKWTQFRDNSMSSIRDAFMQGVENHARAEAVNGEMPQWYKDFQRRMSQSANNTASNSTTVNSGQTTGQSQNTSSPDNQQQTSQTNTQSATSRSTTTTTTERTDFRRDSPVIDLSNIEILLRNIQEFSHISGSKLDQIQIYVSDIRDLVAGNLTGDEVEDLDKLRARTAPNEDDYDKYLRQSEDARNQAAQQQSTQQSQQAGQTTTTQTQTTQTTSTSQNAQQATQSAANGNAQSSQASAATQASQAGQQTVPDMSPIHTAFGDRIDEFADGFRRLQNSFGQTGAGQLFNTATSSIQGMIQQGGSTLGNLASQALSSVAGQGAQGAVMAGLSAAAPAAASALTSVAAAATPAGLALLGLKAASWIAQKAIQKVGQAVKKLWDLWTYDLRKSWKEACEAAQEFGKSVRSAANRVQESRKANDQAAQDRYEADIKTMVAEPFEILKKAANELYAAWDSSIREINQTQGYSKADLQTLIGNYATRLRNEGLQAVVSSADITTNLTKVLESGLSGTVAEEFAYLATKLSAAVPTQDWFSYGSTYASLAAQMIQDGASQTEAIMYANRQLENFASSILYASRQVSGGFSTGLSNAEDIFAKAVKITNASKSTNLTEVSGELASISAAVGAIAPDLANSIIDAVYQSAVGGNSSQIIALRSLAGINASNTQFLKALSDDPKTVFATMFDKLGDMQKMSSDNYMEVAEGLSSIFGLSIDSLSQIDFNYLADAIREMNANSASLDDNMRLLASGASTTTTEQEKMVQINQYMIDEGLSYVLDNEAARAIQEHMWQEQQTRELTQATYAVELRGKAISFLTAIRNLIDNIASFFHLGLDKVDDIIQTGIEAVMQPQVIKEMLEMSKVGNGNEQSLAQLTTYNQDLKLVTGPVGGILSVMDNVNSLLGTYVGKQMAQEDTATLVNAALTSLAGDGLGGSVTSQYSWNVVGKSTEQAIRDNLYRDVSKTAQSIIDDTWDSEARQQYQNQIRAKNMLATMESYAENNAHTTEGNGSGYKSWKAEMEQQYNLKDNEFDTFMTDLGYDTANIEARYNQIETNASVKEEMERRKKEEDFWQAVQDRLKSIDEVHLPSIEDLLTTINNSLLHFYNRWMEYVYNHMLYNNGGTGIDNPDEKIEGAYDHSAIKTVKVDESNKEYNAIYSLSETLSKLGLDKLSDPVVAQNALLAQILVVVNAIMQQNNKATDAKASIIPDTLSALALGITGMSDTSATTAATDTSTDSSSKKSGKKSSKK